MESERSVLSGAACNIPSFLTHAPAIYHVDIEAYLDTVSTLYMNYEYKMMPKILENPL